MGSRIDRLKENRITLPLLEIEPALHIHPDGNRSVQQPAGWRPLFVHKTEDQLLIPPIR